MERKEIKTLARALKKERKVGKELRKALKSKDAEKVAGLSASFRELTREIDQLLPPEPDPLIDL